MKKTILFLSIICASGLTIVSIYNTVVDAKSWGADIPASIQTTRAYYQHVDPRPFYTIAAPVNLILILLTLILFWKDSVSLRLYFAASLVLYVAILILTLAYFNSGPPRTDQSGLRAVEPHELASLIARIGWCSLFIQRTRHLLFFRVRQVGKHETISNGRFLFLRSAPILPRCDSEQQFPASRGVMGAK